MYQILNNNFCGLVTTKKIGCNQIMITRKSANEKPDKAVEIEIIIYYSDKELSATAIYLKYDLSFRKQVAKSQIANWKKQLENLNEIKKITNANDTCKVRGQ